MSECKYGVITGTPTYGGCQGLSQAQCAAAGPWGYSCCAWGAADGPCVVKTCFYLFNPDECPGCNRCADDGSHTYWGWEVTDDRGELQQDVYVEGAVATQVNLGCGLTVPSGRTLYAGGILMESDDTSPNGHIYVKSGGKIYLYGYGHVP